MTARSADRKVLSLALLAVMTLVADLVVVAAGGGPSSGGTPSPTRALPSTASSAPLTTTPTTRPTSTTVSPDVTGMVVPPATGTYHYLVQGAHPGALTRTVTVVTPTPAGTVTEEIRGSDGSDDVVRYDAHGEVELRYNVDNGSQVFACRQKNPKVLLQLPLMVGASWASPFSCTDFVDQRLLIELYTVKVVRRSTAAEAGRSLPTWHLRVVSNQSSTDTTGHDLITNEIDRTFELSAGTGLILREEVLYQPEMGTSGPLTNPSSSVVTLASLEPT